MKNRYYAGFMSDPPAFFKELPMGLSQLRRRLLVVVTDLIVLLYVWSVVSYCVNDLVYHVRSFASLPWWVMLVVVIEAAALWESFGVSIGMRMLGTRLRPIGEHRLGQHGLRYLLWHLSPLFSLHLLVKSTAIPWHERLSGLRTVRTSELGQLPPTPWYTRSWSVVALILMLLSLGTALLVTKVDFVSLFTKFGKTIPLWRGLFRPDFGLLGEGIQLLIVTVFMALMATFFAVAVAVPLSFLAARNLMHGIIGRSVYMVVRTLADIMRSVDAIIWAIIFIVWVRAGAFPGMLALFVQATANLTKLYSERLESIDPGPVEAIRATGANQLQVIFYGILPQIINPYLSFTLYQLDINVRMSTVIGIIGGGGIGQMLYQYMRIWNYRAAGMMMLLIVVIVWTIDYISSRLRARLA
jgi:phosphonate transport system permease protein